MASLSRQELEEIIERDLPGYMLVQHEPAVDSVVAPTEAEEVAPDITQLRKKLGVEDHEPDEDEEASAADVAIVAVQPKTIGDPFDLQAEPKTVVVSATERRIIGSQG